MPLAWSPYWHRIWRRRLSRRRLLASAAAGGVGLGTAALLGCGQEPPSRPGGSPSPPAPAGDAHASPPETSRGGSLRLPGFEAFIADTLDPHQTQFGPVYSSHSAVFSKVLRYQDIQQGIITTDLAEAVPESPDGLEYIISLRRGVRFQRPSLALNRSPSPEERTIDGRELTAEDVVYSFLRQVNPDSPRRRFFYRSYQYEAFDKIEVVDPYTLRLVLKEPLALVLHYLADTNAFVIPREAVDAEDQLNRQEALIGSGPFVWDDLQPLIRSRFVRNPEWFGWDDPDLRRPYMDGYESLFLADDATLEATFREKKIDSALQVANPNWVLSVRQEFPDVVGRDVGFSAWLNTRFLVDRPPFNDLRVRRALHLAADRQQMIDALFQGYGRLQGPLSPLLERWALAEEELSRLPGYRSDRDQREEDLRTARTLYEQAGSPPLPITFANQPSYVSDYAAQFRRQLEDVLGATVDTEIRDYTQIAERLTRGDLPMSWQYDNGWIDPDDWLYPFFHSRGTKNTFRYQDAQLDSMLEAQRREFDEERRRDLLLKIQRYLLDNVLARLDYVTPINLWVAWPYYRNFRPSPFFGESFWLANSWLDRDDPSYRERA